MVTKNSANPRDDGSAVPRSDTRARILEAAQTLVQTIGANAMSYQHISDVVGIRKASIHHYFPTKEDLLEALVNHYNQCVFDSVDMVLATPGTGQEKLRRYIALFEATLRDSKQEKACLVAMLGAEVRTMSASVAGGVKRFYTTNEERLTTILNLGRADGSLQFAGGSAEMAALIFSLLEGAVLVSRGQDDIGHFEQINRQLMRLVAP